MSETIITPAVTAPAVTIPPIAAPAPAAYNPNAMSPEQAASARVTWVAAGLDPAVFDREVSGIVPAGVSGGEAAPVPVATPGLLAPSITPEQATTLAETLERLGQTDAQIAAELARHGYQEDTRSDEQRQHDAAWGFDKGLNTYGPGDYALDPRAAGLIDAGVPIPEQVGILNTWAGVMTALQINPLIGNDLAERLIANSRALASMDEGSRTLHSATEKGTAARIAGSPEAFQEMNRLAGVAIKTMLDNGADADLVEAILKSGAIGAYEIATLSNHGRAIEGWAKGRPA